MADQRIGGTPLSDRLQGSGISTIPNYDQPLSKLISPPKIVHLTFESVQLGSSLFADLYNRI